ncbi:helix-turn-helix domain-containing protein [Lacinutrix chionoecetis]
MLRLLSYEILILIAVTLFLILFLYKIITSKNKVKQQAINLSSLDKLFDAHALSVLHKNQYEVTLILGYFATSLFNKNKTKEVLWDIIENCISKLDLEDCVLYLLDEKQQELCQVAAFGNKRKGEKEIYLPKQIPVGKGIVGSVAKTGKHELVKDTTKDNRYIVDDKKRASELAVPIFLEEKLIGVLDAEHSKQSFFTEKHLYLFLLIAKLAEKKLLQLDQKKGLNITDDNAYYKKVCYLMEEEKLYRDPDIKLITVSEKIKISTNYLSQLINTLSGHNFSDFINIYRIEEVKLKLTDPTFYLYPMLSIGLESGFNSKSAFYNAFKRHTGISPTKFKKIHTFKS